MENSNDVLLTGATGFLGSNLAIRLLLTTSARLFCLVRPPDSQLRLLTAVRSAARAAAVAEPVEACLKRLIALPANLTQPHLGLSQPSWEMLYQSNVNQLWHCAACLRFKPCHRTEIFEQNVAGTQRALDLAMALRLSQFNYISTAYVAGTQQSLIPEQYADHRYSTHNDYEESKRQAEELVFNAHVQGLLQANIFRPSIVIGNSTTFASTSDSGLYGFIAALEQFTQQISLKQPCYFTQQPLRIYTAAGTEVGLNLMPVNLLLQEALAIAHNSDLKQIFYHLSNPFSVPLESIRRALTSVYPNFEIEGVTDIQQLQSIDRLFHKRLQFYHPYLQDNKRFERRRDGLAAPPELCITNVQLEQYVKQFLNRLRWRKAVVPPNSIVAQPVSAIALNS